MKSLAAPDSLFDMRESALPRRRSVRAIFEPLHRTEVDLRDTSLGSDAAKHQLWTKISQNNHSSSAMKSKQLCKFGVINCKSLNSKGNKSTKLNIVSSAFNKSGSRRGSKTGGGMRRSRSKSIRTASSAMTDDGKEDRNTIESDFNVQNSNISGSALLSQLQDMRSKLNDRLVKEFKDKLAEKKADMHLNDVMKIELASLDESFHMSTKYKQPWKNTKLEGHPGSSSISSKKKRDRRSRRTAKAMPNEREKQFRALYDRIRAHYLIQEETCKTMSPKEKLEKTITNTIHFEKELLDYLSLPDADPQAMLVLKELRSRRATMVTKLAAFPQSQQDKGPGTSIVKDLVLKSVKKRPKNPKLPLHPRSSQKLKPKSSSNSAQIAQRRSVKSKSSVVNSSKNMIPQSLRPHTSTRFSHRSISKLFNDKTGLGTQNREADSLASGQEEQNNGVKGNSSTENDDATKKQSEMVTWKKSDFIKLLPHVGEIPKHVSKVEAVESRARWRSRTRDPKAYMRWLEDLISQRLDKQQRGTSPPTEVETKISRMPPRWTQIITRKGKEDPFAPFKTPLEQPSKQTPLLSRPQPKDSKRQAAVSKANSKSSTTTTTMKKSGIDSNEGMNAIEKAIWDVVAHQTKYMEETTRNLPRTNPPMTLPSVNEKSYPRTLFPNVINARFHQTPELAVDTILKANGETVSTRPTSPLIASIISDNRLPATEVLQLPPPPIHSKPINENDRDGVKFSPETSLRINKQQNTSAMPRVMAPVVKPPRYLRENPKTNGRVGPLTSNNIYSSPKSILKSILPVSTGLRPRAPTRSRYPLPPAPSPAHAISPRFLDQFLNRNETKRLMASGQQDAERIPIAT